MPKVTRQTPKGPAKKKAASAVDRIRPMGFDDDEGIKLLLYGRSGTGKTTLWSTFPGPILAMICSGSSRPGELRSVDTPENRKKIKTVTLESKEELDELVEYQLEKNVYNTIVLDHLTGFQDMVLADIIGLDEKIVQKNWGMANEQDYGECSLQCKQRLNKLLSVGCNVVMIAQERVFENKDSDLIAPRVGAGVIPSLAGWIHFVSDYIGQTTLRPKEVVKKIKKGAKVIEKRVKTGDMEYCLRTAPSDVYTTKFRVPKGTVTLPQVIVDPDYGKIHALIRGEDSAEE